MRRTMAGVTLAGLGALVGLAVASGNGASKVVMPRAQPVEVRTEIIRKTVNVYRREHPHHATGIGPGAPPLGTSSPGSGAAEPVATRTRSSGAGAAAPAASETPGVRTRSSGGSSGAGGDGSDHSSGHDD
jgi:hypothetical protein